MFANDILRNPLSFPQVKKTGEAVVLLLKDLVVESFDRAVVGSADIMPREKTDIMETNYLAPSATSLFHAQALSSA